MLFLDGVPDGYFRTWLENGRHEPIPPVGKSKICLILLRRFGRWCSGLQRPGNHTVSGTVRNPPPEVQRVGENF